MQDLFPASYTKIETAEVADGETTVMDDMFAGCVSLHGGATQTDMSMIPNTVTNIGARAFLNCRKLTAFVVPDSVVQIGVSVFQGCSSLWNVTLSRSLTEIPDYAFYGCSSLETMKVPASVTYLGNRFFSGTSGQNALYYLGNAPTYDPSAYAAVAGSITTYVIQDTRGWDGRAGSRVLPQPQYWPAGTYYPITWVPYRFDVTFDANGGRFDASGGSTWSEQQITDTPYALPSTEPVRPGWALEGWWTEPTGGAEVRYTTRVTATRTHTLYAHWRSLGARMTVTFNSNGGTVVTPGTQDYVPGQTFGQFPVPTRRGYTFQGWWTESVNGIRMTEATEVPAADMELFAHWSPITYYVRFNANGGSVSPTTRKVASGAAVGTLPTPSRTGYTFAGWWTSASGGTQISSSTKVTSSVTYYAHWTTGGSSGGGYSGGGSSGGGSYGGGGRGAASSSTVYTRYANGYTWAYRVNGDGVEIVGGYYCDDYGECYVGISPDPTGAVSIPSTLGGKPVRYVGSFGWYDGLTSLTIPDSVKAIASCAFMECSALTSLVVPTWCRNAMYDSRYGDVVQSGGDSGYYLDEESFLSFLFGCPCQGGSDGCSERVAARVRVTYRDVKVSEQGGGSGGGPASAVPVSATSCYEIIGTDIAAPYEAPKAVVLQGAVYDGCKVVGIVELKLGKVNNKKGTGKVSGSVTTLDGKKHTIQAFNLTGIDGTASKSVSLEVKDFGTMSVTIGGTRFAGSMGKYHVQSAAVGGNATGGTKVYVDAGGASLPAGTLEDLLPNGVPVIAAGGKWKFAKAAGVNWTKPKQGAALPERYDAESGKGLVVDTSGDKTNLSGMKLNYTPKKGTFKGTFKVYALEGTGKATKLKKYTVKVSGVVVGGKGWGSATGPGGASFAVTVE